MKLCYLACKFFLKYKTRLCPVRQILVFSPVQSGNSYVRLSPTLMKAIYCFRRLDSVLESWNLMKCKHFCLCLFLYACFHAVKDIPLEPSYFFQDLSCKLVNDPLINGCYLRGPLRMRVYYTRCIKSPDRKKEAVISTLLR